MPEPTPGTPGSLRGSVLASLSGKAAEMVTLALLATVVPRALGPGDYGRFAVPLTVVTLGSLALTLGGPTVMARYVPAAAPEERLAVARAIGGRLARGRAAQLVGIALVAGALATAAPGSFPPSTTALVVVALALNVAASVALQMGLGLGRTGAWSVRYALHNAVLVAGVLVLHERAGAIGAVWAVAVAGLAAAAFAAVVVAPIAGARVARVAVPDGAIRFGVHQATGAALVQCCHRGGVLAVAVLASSAVETGHAALATGIALGVTYAVLQTFTVSLTHLADRDATDAERALRRLAWPLWGVLVTGAAGCALVLDDVIPMAFGTSFGDASTAFAPALALVVLAPLHSLTVQAAAIRFRPEAATASGVAAAVAFLAVSVVAVPSWGAAGGTAAALAAAVAGNVVAVRLLPGAVGTSLAAASFGGAAAVLVVAGLA